jgi:hypothetical protein
MEIRSLDTTCGDRQRKWEGKNGKMQQKRKKEEKIRKTGKLPSLNAKIKKGQTKSWPGRLLVFLSVLLT